MIEIDLPQEGVTRLTEKQAWEHIAELWSRAKPKYFPDVGIYRHVTETVVVPSALGICGSIVDLFDRSVITNDIRLSMEKKLDQYREGNWRWGLYIWKTDYEGSLERTKFCREQAIKCESGLGKVS